MAQFSISGVTIKTPDKFKVEFYNITNLERTQDGKMKGELIARKWKLYLTWNALTQSELQTILDVCYFGPVFFSITFPYNGRAYTKTVYSGSIPTELNRNKGASWVWKDVEIHLIEQ